MAVGSLQEDGVTFAPEAIVNVIHAFRLTASKLARFST
jgi:hypothetical protein